MAGRTSWWPCDHALLRRELVIELGEEFGGDGISVYVQLRCWAQEQRASGEVRGGFRALSREAFVTVSHALSIVERAGAIGLLDEFEVDPDGRRFSCRISGWKADQERGRAALRQDAKRNPPDPDPELVTPSHDESQSVTPKPIHNKRREEKEEANASSTSLAIARELFAYWQTTCNHPQSKPTSDRLSKIAARLRDGYTADQIRQAIDGAARAPYTDDSGKRFDDIELICRNGSKLEDFQKRATLALRAGGGNGHDPMSVEAILAAGREQA